MRGTSLDVPVLHGFPKRRRVRDASRTPSDKPHHTNHRDGHISCHDARETVSVQGQAGGWVDVPISHLT